MTRVDGDLIEEEEMEKLTAGVSLMGTQALAYLDLFQSEEFIGAAANFMKRYYEALTSRGFGASQAMQILAQTPLPTGNAMTSLAALKATGD